MLDTKFLQFFCRQKRNKRLKSKVWKYFSRNVGTGIATSTDGATCNLCQKFYKTSGNTSNLTEHLLRKHRVEYTKSSDVDSADENNVGNQPKTPVFRQETIRSILKRQNPYSNTHPKKKCQDRLLVRLITTRNLPFSLVDYKEFIEYSNGLDSRYIPPNRKTLTSVILPAEYGKMKDKLIGILKGIHVSLTTDTWTSSAVESFLSLTCHFVFNGELKWVLLGASQVDGSHSASNLKCIIEKILMDFGIEKKQIVCLTTDNATVMECVGRELGVQWLGCYCHLLGLIVNDSLYPSAAQRQKEKESKIYEKIQPIIELVEKVKKIVTFFHSSTSATDALIKQQVADNGTEMTLVLVQECKTRWNSLYLMLERYHKLATSIACVLLKLATKVVLPTIDYADLQLLNDVMSCLLPFKNATEKLSGSNYITISLIIPTTSELVMELKAKNNMHPAAMALRDLLLFRVNYRLLPLEKDKLCGMATILDPRFKKLAFQNEDHIWPHILNIQKLIKNSMSKKATTVEKDRGEQLSKSSENPAKKRFFKFMESRLANEKSTTSICESTERQVNLLTEYLNEPVVDEDTNVIQFWNQRPASILKDIALEILIASGSSVASERIFSGMGNLITDKRTPLSRENINMLSFNRNNDWLNNLNP